MRFIQGSFVGIGYIELFCRGCFDGAILTWAVLWAGYFDGAILTGLFCPGLFCRVTIFKIEIDRFGHQAHAGPLFI
jgi:hypothetical protein